MQKTQIKSMSRTAMIAVYKYYIKATIICSMYYALRVLSEKQRLRSISVLGGTPDTKNLA